MKLSLIAISIALLVSVSAPVAFADSGPNSPTVTKGAGNQLAAERAGRNSNGGDRAQGGFGPAQSDYVHSLNDAGVGYGQWLTDSWCTGNDGTGGNCGNN
jgi:hypothetical protein